MMGSKLVGLRPIATVGPIGSRNDCVIFGRTTDGLRVQAGCWSGSAEEFEARVKAVHADSTHGRDYMAALACARVMLAEADS